MVGGLDKFREYFAARTEQYVLCAILLWKTLTARFVQQEILIWYSLWKY